MPVEITIPKFGLTMTEALILEWLKKEGDQVGKGDILFVLETEKVTYEVESPEDGVLGRIVVPEKETVPVGTVVAILLRPGEDAAALELIAPPQAPPVRETPAAAPQAAVAMEPVVAPGGRVKASPLAKKTARLGALDLAFVRGTGPKGMIIREDVDNFAAQGQAAPRVAPSAAPMPSAGKTVALTGMRRAIARKMMGSKTETAQTYMTFSVDAGAVVEYRKKALPRIQEEFGVRVTITDLLMKITGSAISRHPIINTRWTEDGVVYLDEVNMGMAMALDAGLIVPVIRDINGKSLAQVALARQELVDKGRSGKFLPDDISGSTFTLSALGMFGVEQFTANINVPEAAILAVSAIEDKVVAVGGEIKVRPLMNITLSYDHRMIDGAEAAKFMQTLKTLIEDPAASLESAEAAAPARKRVTVIGGGVGGYPAAMVAARMGAEVTLIEKGFMGGTCLNTGCIPTKSLLQSCRVIETIQGAETFGVACDGYRFDFEKIMARKNSVVEQLRNGVEKLLIAKKARIIKGTASMVDPTTVRIEETGEEIKSDRVIIATGSTPRKLAMEGADGPHVWNSDDFLDMDKLPRSVVIVGGGFIGVEFAQILNGLGVEVTILEVLDHLVPGLDKEIALALQKSVTDGGVKVFANARVEKIAAGKESNLAVSYVWDGKTHEISAEKIVYSVGRKPNLEWLDMDRIGLAQVRGALMVDERMETNIPGVYAVGDAAGGVMLAHVAIAEGECAARNAMGEECAISYKAIPACVYTSPEVASVGLTEEKARAEYGDVKIGRFSFHGCGKALIVDETFGMVKIISDKKSGAVLGVHIIGPHATDLISEAVLGMSMNMTVEDLAHAIHPHPTLSEAVMESALSMCGGAIHMP